MGRNRRPAPDSKETIMLAHPAGRESRRPIARSGGARLGRLAVVLAALAGAVLVSAAVIPAASAGIVVPGPGGQYGSAGVTPAQGTGVLVITVGGMAGWQVALIAASAAVVAAAAAVCLDRALTARRVGLVIAAWRSRLARAAHRHAAHPARHPGADPSSRAASTPDTSLPPAAPASGTPDIVEFGRNLTR
jgi:hypothetical protein